MWLKTEKVSTNFFAWMQSKLQIRIFVKATRYSNQESEIFCTCCTLFQPRKSKKILHKLSILDIQDGIFWKKRANIYKYHVDAMQIARGIIQKTEDTVNTLPSHKNLEIFWCCFNVTLQAYTCTILTLEDSTQKNRLT